MTKYALSHEGVQALRSTAVAVEKATDVILDATKALSCQADTFEHLGPHREKLETALANIKKKQEKAAALMLQTKQVLNQIADSYLMIIENDPFADIDEPEEACGTAGGMASTAGAFSPLEASLGREFVNGMTETLGKSAHADVRGVFLKYGSRLQVADTKLRGGAYYLHGEGVHMNIAQVAKGDVIHVPYQTAFHEFGHNIDYIMGNGQPISHRYNDGELEKALQRDFAALKGSMSDTELIAHMKKEMEINQWTLRDVACVSDILESLTGISYPLGVGHGKAYWKNRGPCIEFFAEVLDSAAANESSYQLLKKLFPNAVSVVHKIIGGDLGDG